MHFFSIMILIVFFHSAVLAHFDLSDVLQHYFFILFFFQIWKWFAVQKYTIWPQKCASNAIILFSTQFMKKRQKNASFTVITVCHHAGVVYIRLDNCSVHLYQNTKELWKQKGDNWLNALNWDEYGVIHSFTPLAVQWISTCLQPKIMNNLKVKRLKWQKTTYGSSEQIYHFKY